MFLEEKCKYPIPASLFELQLKSVFENYYFSTIFLLFFFEMLEVAANRHYPKFFSQSMWVKLKASIFISCGCLPLLEFVRILPQLIQLIPSAASGVWNFSFLPTLIILV